MNQLGMCRMLFSMNMQIVFVKLRPLLPYKATNRVSNFTGVRPVLWSPLPMNVFKYGWLVLIVLASSCVEFSLWMVSVTSKEGFFPKVMSELATATASSCIEVLNVWSNRRSRSRSHTCRYADSCSYDYLFINSKIFLLWYTFSRNKHVNFVEKFWHNIVRVIIPFI